MTAKDQAVFTLVQKFCSDNVGNRLNEWTAETLLNRLVRLLELDPHPSQGNAPNGTGKASA